MTILWQLFGNCGNYVVAMWQLCKFVATMWTLCHFCGSHVSTIWQLWQLCRNYVATAAICGNCWLFVSILWQQWQFCGSYVKIFGSCVNFVQLCWFCSGNFVSFVTTVVTVTTFWQTVSIYGIETPSRVNVRWCLIK